MLYCIFWWGEHRRVGPLYYHMGPGYWLQTLRLNKTFICWVILVACESGLNVVILQVLEGWNKRPHLVRMLMVGAQRIRSFLIVHWETCFYIYNPLISHFFLFPGKTGIETVIEKTDLKIVTENAIEEIESGRGRKKRRRNWELPPTLCLSVLDCRL